MPTAFGDWQKLDLSRSQIKADFHVLSQVVMRPGMPGRWTGRIGAAAMIEGSGNSSFQIRHPNTTLPSKPNRFLFTDRTVI